MRSLHVAVLIASLAVAPGCGEEAAKLQSSDTALIERTSGATLAWDVDESGETTLQVRSPMCAPMVDEVKGTLSFLNFSDGTEKTVPLERKGDVLVADGPKLDSEMTEIRYELDVAGEKLEGALHLPGTGTKGLVESAPDEKAAAAANDAAEEGGEVVTVGDDQFEVVADADTGVVKVFPLSAKVDVKEIVLGVGGEGASMLVLRRSERPRLHFAGLLHNDGIGRALTLAVKRRDGKARVALLGLRRKHARYVGKDAPRRPMWASKAWVDDEEELKDEPKANARAKGKSKGRKDKGDDKDKVTICHRPPGNPDNAKTLEVGASSVKAHLAHGDTEGPCDDEKDKDKSDDKDKGKSDDKDKGKSDKDKGKSDDKDKGKSDDKDKGKSDKDKGKSDKDKGKSDGKGKGKSDGKGKKK